MGEDFILMRILKDKMGKIFFVREVFRGSGKEFPRFSECSFLPRENEHSERMWKFLERGSAHRR
jgi:hypothetical protein